jgi:lipoate-protein ligase A
MSADICLLQEAEQGRVGFRVYGWKGVWVSLGMNQDPDQTLVIPNETNWVLRPTGGSAVLHGHDVTVAIALPLSANEGGGRGHTYRLVTAPLVQALLRQGIRAVLAEDLGGDRAYAVEADCFATTTRNDLIDEQSLRKICGCALRRTRKAVLLQASIPAAEPKEDPARLIRGGVRTAITTVDAGELARDLQSLL